MVSYPSSFEFAHNNELVWNGSFDHGSRSRIDLPASWSDRTAMGSFKMEHIWNISRLW
jgi:hypothetical protein